MTQEPCPCAWAEHGLWHIPQFFVSVRMEASQPVFGAPPPFALQRASSLQPITHADCVALSALQTFPGGQSASARHTTQCSEALQKCEGPLHAGMQPGGVKSGGGAVARSTLTTAASSV